MLACKSGQGKQWQRLACHCCIGQALGEAHFHGWRVSNTLFNIQIESRPTVSIDFVTWIHYASLDVFTI